MKNLFSPQRFSMRLLLGVLVLIVLTTLSAGVPAFWLARSQLEHQAWSQVNNAQSATQTLLEAEQNRLTNQLILFTERPTLERLIRQHSGDELQLYLQDFQVQSGLDILLLCSATNLPLIGGDNTSECIPGDMKGFFVLNGRPAILAQQPVTDEVSGLSQGTAVAGIWLEELFLQQLVAATGTQQSILLPDGTRLSSSFTEIGSTAGVPFKNQTFPVNDNTYYAAYMPVANDEGQTMLMSEVALNVDDLVVTERNAFFILAISTAMVALLGSILSIWFVRQVNTPLQRLTAVAEKISQGDLVTAIPLFPLLWKSEPWRRRSIAARPVCSRRCGNKPNGASA